MKLVPVKYVDSPTYHGGDPPTKRTLQLEQGEVVFVSAKTALHLHELWSVDGKTKRFHIMSEAVECDPDTFEPGGDSRDERIRKAVHKEAEKAV